MANDTDWLTAMKVRGEHMQEYFHNLRILSQRFSIPGTQVTKELRRGVGYDHDNAGVLPYNPDRDRLTDRELAAWAVRQIANQKIQT